MMEKEVIKSIEEEVGCSWDVIKSKMDEYDMELFEKVVELTPICEEKHEQYMDMREKFFDSQKGKHPEEWLFSDEGVEAEKAFCSEVEEEFRAYLQEKRTALKTLCFSLKQK